MTFSPLNLYTLKIIRKSNSLVDYDSYAADVGASGIHSNLRVPRSAP
jgi:hypothetical protein